MFKDAEADKEISEDDLDRYLKQVQKSTDEYSNALDSLVSAKEAEIVEV
ncbi:MAG: ribosome recycling factor [Cognaticolwellia sp.]